jgi:hypothetical protein
MNLGYTCFEAENFDEFMRNDKQEQFGVFPANLKYLWIENTNLLMDDKLK